MASVSVASGYSGKDADDAAAAEYAGHTDMEWALNRAVLWNAVQRSGRQWNARLAREVLVHLPPEMTRAQRVALVRRISHELADRYHSAVDFAVHEPRAQADQRHHHAHILMTSRQVGSQQRGSEPQAARVRAEAQSRAHLCCR
jgi:MobA/MobL family